MSSYESRFRPWLDDPGSWPALDLTTAEAAGLAAPLAAGAAAASEKLRNLYGDEAETSGALALVAALGQTGLPEAELRAAVLAVAAGDHYAACLPLPRLRPGDRRWARIRPYLLARAAALLRDNAAEALLWRAVASRIADTWAPQAELSRALQQELSASGLFDEVAVTLELNPPVAGGGRWVALQTKGTLAELRRRLAADEACLLELIRDAEADHPATDIVVAFRLEDELNLGRDGVERVRLWLYDPRRGPQAVSLRLTLADDRVQAVETPADGLRPSVKAVRLVSLAPAAPPLFGWRRHLARLLPWDFFWRLQRHWQLSLNRDKDAV